MLCLSRFYFTLYWFKHTNWTLLFTFIQSLFHLFFICPCLFSPFVSDYRCFLWNHFPSSYSRSFIGFFIEFWLVINYFCLCQNIFNLQLLLKDFSRTQISQQTLSHRILKFYISLFLVRSLQAIWISFILSDVPLFSLGCCSYLF